MFLIFRGNLLRFHSTFLKIIDFLMAGEGWQVLPSLNNGKASANGLDNDVMLGLVWALLLR